MITPASYAAQMNSICEETAEDDTSSTLDFEHDSIASSPLEYDQEESDDVQFGASRAESSFSLAYSYSSDNEKENLVDVELSSRANKGHFSAGSSEAEDSDLSKAVVTTPSGLRLRRSTAASPFRSSSKKTALTTPNVADSPSHDPHGLFVAALKTPDRNVTPSYRTATLLSPDTAVAHADKTPLIRNRANGRNHDGETCSLPTWKSASSIAINSSTNSNQPLFLSPQATRNSAVRKSEGGKIPGRTTPRSGATPTSWSLTSPFVNWMPSGPFGKDKTPWPSLSGFNVNNEQQQRSHTFGNQPNDVSTNPGPAANPNSASSIAPMYLPPTELHELCHDAETIEELTNYGLQHFPTLGRGGSASAGNGNSTAIKQVARRQNVSSSLLAFVTTTDALGRTPLHVLSENNRLIRNHFDCDPDDLVYCDDSYCNQQGQPGLSQKANSLRMQQMPPFYSPTRGGIPGPNSTRNDSFQASGAVSEVEYDIKSFALDFVKQLVQLHPSALITVDSEGFLPFLRTIARWIDHTHTLDSHLRGSRRKGFTIGGGVTIGLQDDEITQDGATKLSLHGLTSGISKTLSIGRPMNKSASVNSVGTSSPHSTHSWNNYFQTNNSSSSTSLGRAFDNCVANSTPRGTGRPQSTDDASISCAEKGVATDASPLKFRRPGLPIRTPGRTDSESSGLSLGGSGKISESRDKHFPKRVLLSPHVEWCLHMLSGIIEHLEDCGDDASLRPGIGMSRATAASGKKRREGMVKKSHLTSSFRRVKSGKPNRESNVRGNRSTICEKIVQNLASIPHLIKTLLLIDDEAKREHIFRLAVVRRVVLDKQSIGKWLTSMLWSDSKRIAQKALNYLDLLSEVSDDEKAWTDASSRDAEKKKQEDLYEAVAQLDNLIPSMIDLDESMQEQAATSKIVRRVMDKMISRPFAVTVVFFDMLFLAVLIASFRFSVHAYLNAYDPSYILKCVYFANTSIFYYIIRELGQVISLTMHKLKHFWSFWNLVDVMSVIMTLSSIIAIRRCLALGNCPLDEGSRRLRCCFALSTGLLWLRVLGLLKSINKQLATFVLAIVQITRDILWFLLILTAAVVSFAQMFYTLLVPASCATMEDSGDDRTCQQAEYYLKSYTVLLGGFGGFQREDFVTQESVVLSIVFTFTVVIILLNILIAIVGDSYEKCLLRSDNLFGRARIVLLAKLVSFQKLLARRSKVRKDGRDEHPDDIDHIVGEDDTKRRKKSIKNCFAVSFLRNLIPHKSFTTEARVFIFLSTSILFAWIAWEMHAYFYSERYANLGHRLMAILFDVLLLCGIILFLKESAESSRKNKEGFRGVLASWYNRSIQKIMYRLLGTTSGAQANSMTKSFEIEHEWHGRLHHLGKEIIRVTGESVSKTKSELDGMQEFVRDTESRLHGELVALQQRMKNSEGRMMEEMKRVEERMEKRMEAMQVTMEKLLLVMSTQAQI